MSDIIEFVLKNFQQLRLADYLILLAFAALAAGAIFIAFRWFYSERFKAQQDLLELQAKTVNALSSHLDVTKQERDELRQQLEAKMQLLRELEKRGPSAADEHEIAREQALVLIAHRIMLIVHRLSIAFQFLYVYASHTSEIPPEDAVAAADALDNCASSLLTKFSEVQESKGDKSLEELVAFIDSPDTSQTVERVYERFLGFADELKNKLANLTVGDAAR